FSGPSPVTSSPATSTRPASGRRKPAIIRSVVVLPQPDGPSRATSSPGAMSSRRSSTMVRPPSTLVSPSSRSPGVVVVGSVVIMNVLTELEALGQLPAHDVFAGQQQEHDGRDGQQDGEHCGHLLGEVEHQ